MTIDLNGGDRRKNTNAKQMPKYIQKERNQYTKYESQIVYLEKYHFPQKKYIQEKTYIALKKKNSHTRIIKYQLHTKK